MILVVSLLVLLLVGGALALLLKSQFEESGNFLKYFLKLILKICHWYPSILVSNVFCQTALSTFLSISLNQLTVMLGPGQPGHLVLQHVDWEPKTGRGKNNFTNSMFLLFFILYIRENIADAKNNGEKCAKLRIIELLETETCNGICSLPGMEKKY